MGDCPSLTTIPLIVRWLLMMVLSFSFYFMPPCELMILQLYQLSYNFIYSHDQFDGGYCDKGYSYLGQQRHTIHVLFSLKN